MLIEPYMYMNLSGEALARYTPPLTAEQLIVIHDDIDLELGCVRIKHGGGAAGHHGIESISDRFGPDFDRVRIGVGRPARSGAAVTHVLSRFDPKDQPIIDEAIERAADAVECLLREGLAAAMTRFNVRAKNSAACTAAHA